MRGGVAGGGLVVLDGVLGIGEQVLVKVGWGLIF